MDSTPHPVAVYIGRLGSKGSKRTMAGAIRTLARLLGGDPPSLPWCDLRYPHTERLRTLLLERYDKPATVNLHLAALRGVLRECWRLGLMPTEDYHRAVDLEAVRGSTMPRGRCVELGEVRAVLAACGRTVRGARDAAMIAVLFGLGLRRAELVGLDVDHLDSETGALKIIRGKGRNERIGFLSNGALDAVSDWLDVRGDESGPLFCPVDRHDRPQVERRLSAQSVYDTVRRVSARAGVKDWSPHDARRTLISNLLDAGVDISTVAKVVGHAQVQTSARYDRRGERALKSASTCVHVPYERG